MDSQPRGDVARFGADDRLGPYQIEELIGVGGMGEIYRAHDTRKSISRTVAIKVLRDAVGTRQTARERFEREAQIISSFTHPHICTLYDVGEQDGVLFLVMEHLVGETLASRLAEGPLEFNLLLRYATEIADAVATAHAREIIHRDLKPSNVMVTDKGTKLLDFGIAKFFSGSDLSTITANITVDGALVGTLRYMSPEVLSGEEADSRSDIFAFGCMLYEMAACRPAFEAQTPAAIVNAILHHEPPTPGLIRPGVPPALDQIITCCLAKNPDDRWQNAADIVHQLKWIADGHLRTPLSDSVLPGPRRGRAKRTVLALAAVMTAAISGGLLSIGTAARSEPWPHITAVPCSGAADLIDETMLCSGLAEELTRRLSKLTASQPIQVTTLGESVRRGVRTVETTRPALGATQVLTGRVTRRNDRVEIDYRVMNTARGPATNDEVFPLAAGQGFEGQDLLTAFVVRRLALQLDHVQRNILTTPSTASAAAFNAYARGLGILRTANRDVALTERMLASFSDATVADPGFAEAHAMHGFAAWLKYEQTHDMSWRDASIASCDRATAADPKLPEGHACRGQWLHAQGRHRDAAAEFQSAVSADRSYDDAIVWLGREFEDERDFAAAEAVYRQAVSNRPAYWASHAWLGNFMRRQGRFEETAAEYELVVQRIPDAARTYAVLGVPLSMIGRYSDAVRAFERSVEIDPTADAYLNWGLTLVRMRQFEQAADKLDKARQLGAGGHQVLGTAARIAFYRRRSEAPELYTRAIEAAQSELANPARKKDTNLALADYCAKLGRQDEARKYLSDAAIDPTSSDRPSDPHLLFSAALVLNQLGDRSAALAWLDRAVYWGVPPSELMAVPELDGLHDEPAFKNLISRKRGTA